ncbi:glycosyltransferase [Patiriisocius hiemis]|uniref:Glycosyltransferase n=1 Tax=Patiriisocius hiemis TaxID=3075604 RepID=A0ABU2YCZ8_9FLAO|nr:glycosyltransferase [Constantimarinum sp. W242]MDT0556054.1 glycosyltransferase [Constantimarinum sp. W242]
MKFLIITHTSHIVKNQSYYAYEPYVREMNLWMRNVSKIHIVAPIKTEPIPTIFSSYESKVNRFTKVPSISFISFFEALKAIFSIPLLFLRVSSAMQKTDHIHLRCPGIIGLIGCFAQIFFPKKSKTVKYAGNWDPQSKQPLSYKIQKWIVSNTFLTKNCKVLVYGEWKEQSDNIRPFFTASYTTSQINTSLTKEISSPFHFLFVGSLVPGKRPLYAIKLVEKLLKNGIFCSLSIYGDGGLYSELKNYIETNNLSQSITLHGNQSRNVIIEAYKVGHFLILPSKSEGWPKVVAEAMFWGCIPLATKISCVPWMLGKGKRGHILTLSLDEDKQKVVTLLNERTQLETMSKEAQTWSHEYTLDSFEAAIKKLL